MKSVRKYMSLALALLMAISMAAGPQNMYALGVEAPYIAGVADECCAPLGGQVEYEVGQRPERRAYVAPQRDPFETMFDSNERFQTEAEPLLRRMIAEERAQGGELVNVASDSSSTSNSRGSGVDAAVRHSAAREDVAKLAESFYSDLVRSGSTRATHDVMQEDSVHMWELEQIFSESRPNRYIVQFKEAGNARSLPGAASVEALDSYLGANGPQLITLSERVNPKEYAETLRARGFASQIEYIQPDFVFSLAGLSLSVTEIEPEDSKEDETTGSNFEPKENETPEDLDMDEEELDEIDEEEEEEIVRAPVAERTGAAPRTETIVAVIDTGIDIHHPGLSGLFVDGWNFVDETPVVFDQARPLASAHGTHVAGIIKEASGGSGVKVMPLKVFGDHGAYTSDIIRAIEYAETNGASVANLSFGSSMKNPALEDAMAVSGMLFVTAAGNSRSDISVSPVYPAAYNLDNLISVTSLNNDGGLSFFSNYGRAVDIAALGRDVYSTLPGNTYGVQSGTSMATAQVSGIAAAVLVTENMNSEELKDRLLDSADILSNLQGKVAGSRRANLSNAMSGSPGSFVSLTPAPDFDVGSWNPTPSESWELFSASGTVKQIAAGEMYSTVLMTNGTVWSWGMECYCYGGGALPGAGETVTQVIGLTNVVYIYADYVSGIAVKSDGTVWTWDNYGYCDGGDDEAVIDLIPFQITGLTDIKSISGVHGHTLALKTDGTVWAWGHNSYGQIGNGTTTYTFPPVQVQGLTGVESVSVGDSHSLALKTDGTVWAWGRNNVGQLGDGTTTNRSIPVQVSGLTGVESIEAGQIYSLAVKTDGTLWAWGYNAYGQLGNGSTTNSHVPIQPAGLTEIAAVATNFNHNLAVKKDGTVWAWGQNTYGQLGDDTTIDRLSPVQTEGLTGAKSVTAGGLHSLALKIDGTLWGWGGNYYGQLGDGTTIDRFTPVQVLVIDTEAPDLSTISLDVTTDSSYLLAVEARGMTTFAGRSFTLYFDPQVFDVIELCALSKLDESSVGQTTQAGVTFVSFSGGEVVFTVNKAIPQGKAWSGVLNVFRLKAKEDGISLLGIS